MRNARIKSRCNHAGCRTLCTGPHCDQHKAEHVWSGKRRGKTTERGYGAAWRAIRKCVLDENPCCEQCMKTGRPVPATEVDHIVPKAQGGTDDRADLQALCARCHDAKSLKEAQEARHGCRCGTG